MPGLRKTLSIHRKLVLVSLITSVVAQLFAGVILTLYDGRSFKTQKIRAMQSEAAITASTVAASLYFDDAKAAREYLNALKANPEIEAAGVYSRDNRLFASYRLATARALPDTPLPFRQEIDGDRLTISLPVIEGGEPIGAICLRAVIEPISHRIFRYGAIILSALVFSLVVTVPFSIRLNRAISDPIRKMADAAAQITKGDFTPDIAPNEHDDEIGLLTRAFRKMVAGVREMTNELERRVAQRTIQLEAANRELEAFSYTASHDLRAPLRAIVGFSKIIETDYRHVLDQEGQRLLAVVRDSATHMSKLIDDLLAFSKLGRQSLKITPIDMTALVGEIWAEIQRETPGNSALFKLSPLIAAQADRSLIRQVWLNLLSNAVKYSGGRAEPVIEVVAEETANEVIYRVSDNGAGFDMNYSDKLFGVFQRLHSVAEFPGTGVGLAIVQRIILRHGGRVWADGKVGQGASFYFSLPKPQDL